MTHALQPGSVCAFWLGSVRLESWRVLFFCFFFLFFLVCFTALGGSIALRVFLQVVFEIAQVGHSSSSQQHRPHWQRSPSTSTFSHWLLLGRGQNNPPVTGQPISPSVAECYVSWRYLLKDQWKTVESGIIKG